jgi:hypothetical protein
MLQVFHAKWYSRLPEGECSEATMSLQSSGGVALCLATQKTDSRLKCLRRVCGSGTKKCGGGMKSRGSGMMQ